MDPASAALLWLVGALLISSALEKENDELYRENEALEIELLALRRGALTWNSERPPSACRPPAVAVRTPGMSSEESTPAADAPAAAPAVATDFGEADQRSEIFDLRRQLDSSASDLAAEQRRTSELQESWENAEAETARLRKERDEYKDELAEEKRRGSEARRARRQQFCCCFARIAGFQARVGVRCRSTSCGWTPRSPGSV